MTTWEYAHVRGRSTARRLSDWVMPHLKRLGGFAKGVRRYFWPIAGAGCFVVAAFTVSLLAGLIAAGVACFFVEWRFAK